MTLLAVKPMKLMPRRRGLSLLETFVAGALLATMLVVSLQFVKATTAQRRESQHRQLAVQEAANMMERAFALRWSELTTEAVRGVQPCAEARGALADLQWTIDVAQPSGEPAVKRVVVQLRWQGVSGQPLRPVRLVAWKHPEGGDR